MRAAANGGVPLRLQSARLVAAVAELGSLGDVENANGQASDSQQERAAAYYQPA